MTTVYTPDSRVWITSDLHLGHDKPFIWEARGFDSVQEMNQTIIERFNSLVKPEDDLYLLGDTMLGKLEDSKPLVAALNGKKHFIIGNHDSNMRTKYYEELGWINEGYATIVRKGKWRFYLSHYPTLTANFDDNNRHLPLINLFGHTHQTNTFWNDNEYMVNVGVDAHNCAPLELEEVKNIIRDKREEKEDYGTA